MLVKRLLSVKLAKTKKVRGCNVTTTAQNYGGTRFRGYRAG